MVPNTYTKLCYELCVASNHKLNLKLAYFSVLILEVVSTWPLFIDMKQREVNEKKDRKENLKEFVSGHAPKKITNCYLHLKSATLTLVSDKTRTAGLR